MFGVFRKKSESYSGRDAYRYLEPMIRKASALYIISPYVDSYYAKFLRGNLNGKKVYMISSSIDPRAKKLLAGRRDRLSLLAYVPLILALAYVSAAMDFYFAAVATVSGIALVVLAYLLVTEKKTKNLNLKVPSSFVHAKMYISNSMAIEGSANLTYKGMHSNVEHITITRSAEDVESLKKEFFRLWDSL